MDTNRDMEQEQDARSMCQLRSMMRMQKMRLIADLLLWDSCRHKACSGAQI